MSSIQSLTMTCDALNEYGTFSEGDTLTGKLTLALLKETKIECLFVKAKGDADVRWTKKSGDHTKTYSAHNRYFKLKQFLTPEDCKDTVLPRGCHVFNFSLKIPPKSMPSSFKGSHGKIVYTLEAKLSRSWKLDRTVEQIIQFVSKSYQNINSMMSPQIDSKKKEMGLFSKGHVDMEVKLDRMGYAQGESIVIVARINNASSSEMIPKFRLIQEMVYHAKGSTKHEAHNILKVVGDDIKPQTQKDVTCAMKIPRDQMPTIENCDIISVKYYLKAYLDISLAFDPEVFFPVVVMPLACAPGPQPGVAAGPYPAGAVGGPSNSDFPPPALSYGPHPVSPHSGSYGNPGAQRDPPFSFTLQHTPNCSYVQSAAFCTNDEHRLPVSIG
ncbi:arrestin domain-containing protein 3-like isoform X2 [Cottoperca gobio]|uniref:Arrestin domain-containing protein 3-like isoform X2 n=1 Tax=Cottoperca gobio TaxID=56716 RepID=A0A6J2QFG8_COTGO|nr:arrestin domain-containing protein 3-like isoform X2 [Cottoperca gobio]